ncbi:uncharacterized protein LOC122882950 [Siniperca chuatsi]|uniref:uncharacterized protein LOC122882950 n=1 Tax=Siniperca chuatsi TaxID=119488 RepID=UPI001CE13104|nr:uncharacterized protein LOC122882950 [Siniperca chuatsi]
MMSEFQVGNSGKIRLAQVSRHKHTRHHSIFADRNMNLFLDEGRTQLLNKPSTRHRLTLPPTTLMVRVQIHVLGLEAGNMNEEAGYAEQGDDEMPCTSAASAPLPPQQRCSFNREQTLFLIDLMRQKLEAEGGAVKVGGPQHPGIMHLPWWSYKDPLESSSLINYPLWEDRIETLPVQVITASDDGPLDLDITAINCTYDAINATDPGKSCSRCSLLTVIGPGDGRGRE